MNQPHKFELAVPVGSADHTLGASHVRSGSVKRIASAVGEGSISIQFVHRALQDIAGASH